jgi:hypothetical protein
VSQFVIISVEIKQHVLVGPIDAYQRSEEPGDRRDSSGETDAAFDRPAARN